MLLLKCGGTTAGMAYGIRRERSDNRSGDTEGVNTLLKLFRMFHV